MPNYSGIWTLQQQMQAEGAGNWPDAPAYFIATLGDVYDDRGNGITIDNSGNIYVVGNHGAYGSDLLIAKYNSSGIIQWQKRLGNSSGEYGYGIAVDFSNNIYVVGQTASTGAGGNDVLIAKYNSSGAIQWQRTLGGASSDYGYGITVDSSDNIYIVGNTNSAGGGSEVLTTKYDSSGTIQWQRKLGGASSDYGRGITIDSSGNIYVTGYTDSTGAGLLDLLIAKYDSSGTIQWQRVLGGASYENGNGIAVDSSDNIYVIGRSRSTGAGNDDLLIVKYDSSGTIQWQKVLGGSGTDQGTGITIDSSDNIYVVGYTTSTGAGSEDFLIVKYDSSGTIQWQRTLGGTGTDYGLAITIDSSGAISVTGFTTTASAGSNDVILARLPGDGSLTGTYGSFTYAASSLTSATSSLTSATSSLTSATSSLTSATSSLSQLSSSLTSTVIIL